MNRFFVRTLLCLALSSALAPAESADPVPTPTPPFLAGMPDNTTWTISVTGKDMPAKLPPGVKLVSQLVSTKSGATRLVVSVFSNGSQTELWFSHGFRLQQMPPRQDVLVLPDPTGGSDPSADYPHLNWLRSADYVGVESQKGQACWHFKTQLKLESQKLIVDCAADINLKTKRPVMWDVGPTHYELVSSAPASLPAMPPAFATALKTYATEAAVPNAYRK